MLFFSGILKTVGNGKVVVYAHPNSLSAEGKSVLEFSLQLDSSFVMQLPNELAKVSA